MLVTMINVLPSQFEIHVTQDAFGKPLDPRDYTKHGHPAISVPCPDCGQPAGAACLRPSGRRAANTHVARRNLVDLLLVVDFGDSARFALGSSGWTVEQRD